MVFQCGYCFGMDEGDRECLRKWVKILGFAGMLFIYLKVASKKVCQATVLYTSLVSLH